METIHVQKDKLTKRLKKNRKNHQSLFERAQEGYKQAVIESLEKDLSRAQQGKNPRWEASGLPVPRNHTKDYDAALDMVKSDTRDVIELSEHEFRTYLRDEWNWRREFIGTNAAYGVG